MKTQSFQVEEGINFYFVAEERIGIGTGTLILTHGGEENPKKAKSLVGYVSGGICESNKYRDQLSQFV